MLLLKMLQAATRASADKDRVRLTPGLGSGLVLHFLLLLLNFQPVAGQVQCGAGAWEPAALPAAQPSEPLCLPAAPGSSRPRAHPNRGVRRHHEGQVERLLRHGQRFQEPGAVARWVVRGVSDSRVGWK